MRRFFRILAVISVLTPLTINGSEEVSFIEDFILSQNKEETLKKLIPGTIDHFYYHALYFESKADWDQLDRHLRDSKDNFGNSAQYREILHRKAVLTYVDSPNESLNYIRRQLGLTFSHSKIQTEAPRRYASTLNPKLHDWETLASRYIKSTQYGLSGYFPEGAYDRLLDLAADDLNGRQIADILNRLTYPNHPKIMGLVIKDLQSRYAPAFGTRRIHNNLVVEQLDQLVNSIPKLKNSVNFVNAYLRKMRPSGDVDWRHDPKAAKSYLNKLWSLASQLGPVHNSLKLHVLYHRLSLDRTLGVYDKDLFMTYIKLPRHRSYMNPKYVTRMSRHGNFANYGTYYNQTTGLDRVNSDDELVADFLHHFLADEDGIGEFMEFLDDKYLKRRLAETKITGGIGERDSWAKLITPHEVKQLRERIDIKLAPTNKTHYKPGENVSLDVDIKNVDKLIVRVFNINTFNYYKAGKTNIDLSINLDGLVTNDEKVIEINENPFIKKRHTIKFPQFKGRGIHVVELIGNGMRSRALIKMGNLRLLDRTTAAGHVFAITDENGEHLKDARIWMAEQEYQSDDKGRILIPYSTKPATQKILLRHGNFTTVDTFNHLAENISLKAGFFVDREALVRNRDSQVLIRPLLTVNGFETSPKLLEQSKLTLRTTDHDGLTSVMVFDDLKFSRDAETLVTFRVPDNLATIHFSLTGEVANFAKNTRESLSTSHSINVNGMNTTSQTATVYMSRSDKGYSLSVLGRNGEPRAHAVANLALKHRDLKSTIHVSLQANERGRITLGALNDIDKITANIASIQANRSFNLDQDLAVLPNSIHLSNGETLVIPDPHGKPDMKSMALFEVRDNLLAHDLSSSIKHNNGTFEVEGLKPGDYHFVFKKTGKTLTVRVGEGQIFGKRIFGPARDMDRLPRKPLYIKGLSTNKKTIDLKLGNVGSDTRVHVVVSRFVPARSIYSHLLLDATSLGRAANNKPESLYMSGVRLSDEYRYILNRRYAQKYPGNMLERPTLLLNPMELHETSSKTFDVGTGGGFGGKRGNRRGGRGNLVKGMGGNRKTLVTGGDNMDFLENGSVLLANLEPDEDGNLSIDRSKFIDRQHVKILVLGREGALVRSLALEEKPVALREVRLMSALDTNKHFRQQTGMNAHDKGATFRLGDINSSTFEVFDSIQRVYDFFSAQKHNAKLTEFSFITSWNTYDLDKKIDFYSKYASHELHFYLYKKDRKFFDDVIKDYLKNKKDKTFLDNWLLGNKLDAYVEPWAFSKLNIVEKILLGQRLEDNRTGIVRRVREAEELLAPNPGKWDRLLKAALTVAATGEDRFGLSMRRSAPRPKSPGSARDGYLPMEETDEEPSLNVEELQAQNKARSKLDEANEKKSKDQLSKSLESENSAMDLEDFNESKGRYMEDRRRLYRKLKATKEYVENNYHNLTVHQQGPNLVNVSRFWRDYAEHSGEAFLSGNFIEATDNFTEMMFALSVLDLPFKAGAHEVTYRDASMTFEPASPALIVSREIIEAGDPDESQIIVSQNYYPANQRFRYDKGVQIDNFINDEFLTHRVYGSQVVVTNPTSSRQRIEVLVQIPKGAIGVARSRPTRSVTLELRPYSTSKWDFQFYFPKKGDWTVFPVHVSSQEKVIAQGKPFILKVLDEPSTIDTTSWNYVSQEGSEGDVLKFLENNNLLTINLNLMAFRLRSKEFYHDAVTLLKKLQHYHATTWSYAMRHGDTETIKEYLENSPYARIVGLHIDSPILQIDPIEQKTYQHMEYKPLVNARAHMVSAKNRISNKSLYQQYHKFLKVLSYKGQLDSEDQISLVYYLFLQDRVTEALDHYDQIDKDNIETQIQYDYLTIYRAFYLNNMKVARSVAESYQNHTVIRWRNRFKNALSQINEIESGAAGSTSDPEDRDQDHSILTSTSPVLELEKIEGGVNLNWRNVSDVQVNFYLMDTELIFSSNPFVKETKNQFLAVEPNATLNLDLDGKSGNESIKAPADYANRNVFVEVTSGGLTRTTVIEGGQMRVQMTENYGQLTIRNKTSGDVIPKIYVKVYVRTRDGRVRFHKDGYSDLRGRFDYASVSETNLDDVDRFAILVFDEKKGAVIREAMTPKR